MITTTRRVRPWQVLWVVPILALAALACPPGEGETPSSRLSDLEPSPSAGDKARSESSEPLPMPEEPAPWASPGEPRPSAKLLDLELAEADAPSAPAATEEPSPLPEEPPPGKKGKKEAG